MPTSDEVDTPDFVPSGSGRGIFTDADRDFLRKTVKEREEEYHRASRIQRWNDIQERLHYGIHDLSRCIHHLPHETRRDVYNGLFPPKSTTRSAPFLVTARAIGFLLLGCMEVSREDLDDEELLEQIVERSLFWMFRGSDFRSGPTPDVDVDVTVENWTDIREWERESEPEDLPDRALHNLYVMGELTQEEFARGVLADELEE